MTYTYLKYGVQSYDDIKDLEYDEDQLTLNIPFLKFVKDVKFEVLEKEYLGATNPTDSYCRCDIFFTYRDRIVSYELDFPVYCDTINVYNCLMLMIELGNRGGQSFQKFCEEYELDPDDDRVIDDFNEWVDIKTKVEYLFGSETKKIVKMALESGYKYQK